MNIARSCIEAFRYGIVPRLAIREWTFGRDKELLKIFSWLKDDSSGSLVIEGAYGTGKSHLLKYLHTVGIDSRFLVSISNINPIDTPVCFPKRVYRNIVRNFRYIGKNGVGDFRNFLIEVSNFAEKIKKHKILYPILIKIKNNEMKKSDWEYIFGLDTKIITKGDDLSLPLLPDHTTSANVYCYILSGISWISVNYLNQKGFLILLDEMELTKTYRYSYEYKRGINFLDGLSKTAFDDDGLNSEKIAKIDYVYKGEISNLLYSGFTKVPYSFSHPSFLKLVVAITPDFIHNFGNFLYNDIVTLENLSLKDQRMFLYKIFQTYISLNKIHISPLERRWLFEYAREREYTNIRTVIKTFIECLDFKRYYQRWDVKDIMKFA